MIQWVVYISKYLGSCTFRWYVKTSQIQASSVALHSLLTVTARFSRHLEVQVHSHTSFISFLLIFHAVKTCLFSAKVRHKSI